MAEGSYEFECMRAELLGIAKPDEEEFQKLRAEKLKQMRDEIDAAEAELLEGQDESMENTNSKFDELNSILSSTQQKINRFKKSACGSLSNIFSRGSVDMSGNVDVASKDSPVSTSATASRRNTTACTSNTSEVLDKTYQEGEPVIPTEKIRAAKMDINKKMTSHLDKLDSMLNKAEKAEMAMSEQTKQMRKMAQ